MQREFNVFSPVIVVYEGETFRWTVNQAELGTASQIVVSPADGSVWPLDKPSYTVTPSTPATAKVTGNVGVDFECSPPATNVGEQKIITTPHPAGPACNGVTVAPGNYFIWLNESAETLIIRPNTANPSYWPLPQPSYAVPPNSWIAVAIPSDARDGQYPVTVADKLGQPQCPDETQPIIIVQSN
ncbi:MAG TPA: hypothetical protein VHZ09_16500 [Acidobacteriaceae bacterium]|jgi:hypothetical protein|nr:hypothetical protein [Acidobacteriaceae bacterium]